MSSSFQILGVRIDAVEMPDAVARVRSWIDRRDGRTRFVAVTAMHGIAEARRNAAFRQIVNSADLAVPDGMPLIWFARLRGHALKERVCGPELVEAFCRATGSAYRHFFYGGVPGVAEQLAAALHARHGIVVAGTYCPPFRSLSETEENELIALIEKVSPDLIWVGLSSPKQEQWMYEHRDKLNVPGMLGVGAAFDMNSGKTQRAPMWMRKCCIEWLYRLLSEPRRLWKRYLVTIPGALGFAFLEFLGFPMLRGQSDQELSRIEPVVRR